jgi:hypothetical protein
LSSILVRAIFTISCTSCSNRGSSAHTSSISKKNHIITNYHSNSPPLFTSSIYFINSPSLYSVYSTYPRTSLSPHLLCITPLFTQIIT